MELLPWLCQKVVFYLARIIFRVPTHVVLWLARHEVGPTKCPRCQASRPHSDPLKQTIQAAFSNLVIINVSFKRYKMVAETVISDTPPLWGCMNPLDYVGVTTHTLAKRLICMRLLPPGATDSEYPGFHQSIRYCIRDLPYTLETYRRDEYGRHRGSKLYWFPFGEQVKSPPAWESFPTVQRTYEDKDTLYKVSGGLFELLDPGYLLNLRLEILGTNSDLLESIKLLLRILLQAFWSSEVPLISVTCERPCILSRLILQATVLKNSE